MVDLQKFPAEDQSKIIPENDIGSTEHEGDQDTISAQLAVIRSTIDFLHIVDSLDFIRNITLIYPEMAMLTGAVDATPESSINTESSQTIGQKLFPKLLKKDLIEFERTAVGILCLLWGLSGDYESFTACQKRDKLSRSSFARLHEYTKKLLPDKESVEAMITYTVINDLGKIKSVVEKIKMEKAFNYGKIAISFDTALWSIIEYAYRNTMAKIEDIVNTVKQAVGESDVDHDKVLVNGLQICSGKIAPSFQRLEAEAKESILNGLRAEFNIAQFIQGECPARSLQGLSGTDANSLQFYLLHALYDIAGAAGHNVQNGSAVMTESTYNGFEYAIGSIEKLSSGLSFDEVYDDYLNKRATDLGLDISNPTDRAVTRLCCMLRYYSQEKAELVKNVFARLHPNIQVILNHELNINGTNDGYATLLYYSPALLANLIAAFAKIETFIDDFSTQGNQSSLIKSVLNLPSGILSEYFTGEFLEEINKLKDQSGFEEFYDEKCLPIVNLIFEGLRNKETSLESALSIGFQHLARLFQETRISIKKREGNGVYTSMCSKVAEIAAINPFKINELEFKVEKVRDDGQIELIEPVKINSENFVRIKDLSELPGERIGVVAIGGGSDCIQGAIEAKMLENAGKEVPVIISVRTATTESQDTKGKVGIKREITNPKAVMIEGRIYEIDEQSSGSGRFFENIPARDRRAFLIIDHKNENQLRADIQRVLEEIGTIDAVMAVDTGGDGLYKVRKNNDLSQAIDSSRSTPDQDLRVMIAVNGIPNITKLTSEIAVGIDSPDYAEEVLQSASAKYFDLSPDQRQDVLDTYKDWGIDGSRAEEGLYGKTPFGWQLALKGKFGIQIIDIPSSVVVHKKNPWMPFVHIQVATQGIFIMKMEDHLKALGQID